METKTILWDKNSEELQPLRLPKCTSNTTGKEDIESGTELINFTYDLPKTSNTQTKNDTIEDIIARSTLKVDAPEWYPSSCGSDSCLQSFTIVNVHDSKNISEESEADKFKTENLLYELYGTNEDSPDIIRLKQIINALIKDPGQFDNMLDLFMETLQPYFQDVIALSIIAQLLVEQNILVAIEKDKKQDI